MPACTAGKAWFELGDLARARADLIKATDKSGPRTCARRYEPADGYDDPQRGREAA